MKRTFTKYPSNISASTTPLFKRAKDPNTSSEELDKLAKNTDAYGLHTIQCYIASNPNTSVDTLRYLAEIGDAVICRYVARNPKCPEDILEEFANSPLQSLARDALNNLID